MENEITFDGTVVGEVRKNREAVFIVSIISVAQDVPRMGEGVN